MDFYHDKIVSYKAKLRPNKKGSRLLELLLLMDSYKQIP